MLFIIFNKEKYFKNSRKKRTKMLSSEIIRTEIRTFQNCGERNFVKIRLIIFLLALIKK